MHVEFTLIHFNSAMLDVLLKDVIGGKMRLCNLVCRGQSNTTEHYRSDFCFVHTTLHFFFFFLK